MTYKVLHVMRSVGPTSIPWNDLYSFSRSVKPETFLPPLIISLNKVKSSFQKEYCNNQIRKYFRANIFSGINYVRSIKKKHNDNNSKLILHFHAPSLFVLALITKFFIKDVKIVFNMHSDWKHYKWYQKIGLLSFAKTSDRFVTVSNVMKTRIPKKVRNKINVNGELISITNGIDSNKFRILKKSENKTDWNYKNKTTAIVAARMVPAKNYKFILKLLSMSNKIDLLIWYGDGFLRKHIEQDIINLGLTDRIELKGLRPRNEVLKAFLNGDIYISASIWEGIGVANLEASALGCWPFLSKIPAHDEISKNIDIETYPLNDIKSWNVSIDNYLSLTKQTQEEMRNNLSEQTLSKYNLRNTVENYMLLYNEI